jgi:hypothetical protein
LQYKSPRDWLRALKSGEYKKANGSLVRGNYYDDHYDSYCCLGVLCDIRGAQWKKGSAIHPNDASTKIGDALIEARYLPEWFRPYPGQKDETGETITTPNQLQGYFARLNDRSEGTKFSPDLINAIVTTFGDHPSMVTYTDAS